MDEPTHPVVADDYRLFSGKMQDLFKQRLPVIANVLLVLFLIGFALQTLGAVFQPFLMAVLVYFILKPRAILAKEKIGLPMGWAFFVVVLAFVIGMFAVCLAVAWSVQSYTSDSVTIAAIGRNYGRVVAFISNSGLFDVSAYSDPSAIFSHELQGALGSSLLNGLFATVTMVLFLAFIIVEVPLLEGRVARAFPGGKARRIIDVSHKIENSINAYLWTKTAVSIGTGVCTSLLCLLLGVPLWFLWGLLAFLLNYVPYIGSMLACAPPIILGFLAPGTIFFVYELSSPFASGIMVMATLTLNQLIWGSIIETKWQGRSLDVSPVILLLAFAYGGFVWGAIGMILSAPLIVIIKIVLENIEPTRPVAILMQQRVQTLRELYSEALKDGSLDRAEEVTIQKMVADLGIDEGTAYVVAARAAFDVAAASKEKNLLPNDIEMHMIARAMDHLGLDDDEREKILSFLDDGVIDAEEAMYLDKVFPDEHGTFTIRKASNSPPGKE